MSSSKPYMLRAIYEWIVDNDYTPHLLVNALADGVVVPQEHVQDGQIVLNVSPSAVRDLHMGNDEISFNGRFGGVPRDLYVPVFAVMGLYAKENGEGLLFTEEDSQPPPESGGDGAAEEKPGKPKPGLRLVK